LDQVEALSFVERGQVIDDTFHGGLWQVVMAVSVLLALMLVLALVVTRRGNLVAERGVRVDFTLRLLDNRTP